MAEKHYSRIEYWYCEIRDDHCKELDGEGESAPVCTNCSYHKNHHRREKKKEKLQRELASAKGRQEKASAEVQAIEEKLRRT